MHYAISQTSYGGRGCFAQTFIPKDTVVHICRSPFTSVIFRDFRREVCGYCYKYDMGRTTWKVRLERLPYSAGLLFCTEECRDRWVKREDKSGQIAEILETIEVAFLRGRKRLQQLRLNGQVEEFEVILPEDGQLSPEQITTEWIRAEDLVVSLSKQNSKVSRDIKASLLGLEDAEYDITRLIAVGVVRDQIETSTVRSEGEKQEILVDPFSWSKLWDLESHEIDLLKKTPSLLQAHIKAYLFLKMILPQKYKSYVTSVKVRGLVGREASNTFGIWQLPLSQESECLGSAVFPSASYFNHSCRPNISKLRRGREMHFIANRDIDLNEELSISYGLQSKLDVVDRQMLLQEQWYFQCRCRQCLEDLHKIKPIALATTQENCFRLK